MRVLITNHKLSTRTGTELYVRDLALGLLAKGHSPIVYSPQSGSLAAELRALTVPVVTDLAKISTSVDIIHGHHRHETMTALLHFPGVPAVFFVHDWHSCHDLPPVFPRILRYVAIDGTRRDRLLLENGIPESLVTTLPNGVDINRFSPRAPLPERPQHGLVFSNYVKLPTELTDLNTACTNLGVTLDVVGAGMKRSVTEPEHILGNYDLVFAMGRSALEAMAVGTGVIVWGLEGLGGFVHTGNFFRLQDSNFGRRALRPVNRRELEMEIRRFNRDEAQSVQHLVRSTLSQSDLIDRHVTIYQDIIQQSAARSWELVTEMRDAANYLQLCLPIAQKDEQATEALPRRNRQRRRLIDVAWASLSLFVVAFGVRVETMAFTDKAYGLMIGSIPICLLLCFGLFILRKQLRGDPIA